MAKRAGKKPKAEPLTVGDVFVMRLADGRYGACRVVRLPGAHESHVEEGRAMVAATEYIGDAPPEANDPSLRRLLVLSHHVHKGTRQDVCSLWLAGPPAAGFEKLGRIEPSAEERKLPCNSYSDWAYFPFQVLLQWRWDHDREAVLAEDVQSQRQADERLAELERDKQNELARMTYASFRRRKLFKNWTDYPPRKMIDASRRIMQETATKLEALGPNPDREQARAILGECILAFNDLDEANDHWIETIEREDICEHFYELAHLAGFDDEPELADEWREW
jgi:hypothetical protein